MTIAELIEKHPWFSMLALMMLCSAIEGIGKK